MPRTRTDRMGAAEPSAATAAVILAGGRGTRMGGAVPKVLVELAGLPLLLHVLGACRAAGVARCVVVAGEHETRIRRAVGEGIVVVRQPRPRGTGDALRTARAALAGFEGDLLVLVGDAPLVSPELLVALRADRRRRGDAATLATARFPTTPPYGRVVRGAGGEVLRVVDEASASPEERAIEEVSTYPFCLDAARALPLLDELAADPATGEVLLPDLVGRLVAHGERVSALEVADPWQTLGVNTPEDLVRAEAILRRRRLDEAPGDEGDPP